MSSMKKLLESIDAIEEASAYLGPVDTVTITMTRQQALEQGLLTCQCGHPENNHFNHTDSCAHCHCQKYQEKARVGKINPQIESIEEGIGFTTISNGQSFLSDIAKAFDSKKDRTLNITVTLKGTNVFEYQIDIVKK